jgi:hypothetical protein
MTRKMRRAFGEVLGWVVATTTKAEQGQASPAPYDPEIDAALPGKWMGKE